MRCLLFCTSVVRSDDVGGATVVVRGYTGREKNIRPSTSVIKENLVLRIKNCEKTTGRLRSTEQSFNDPHVLY